MIPLALALLIVSHFQKRRFSALKETTDVGQFLNGIRLSLLGGDGLESLHEKTAEWRHHSWYPTRWTNLSRQYWAGTSLVELIDCFARVNIIIGCSSPKKVSVFWGF